MLSFVLYRNVHENLFYNSAFFTIHCFVELVLNAITYLLKNIQLFTFKLITYNYLFVNYVRIIIHIENCNNYFTSFLKFLYLL